MRTFGKALAHGADQPLDRKRRGPAHGVGERDLLDVEVVRGGDLEDLPDQADHALRRHLALEIAAEGRHHRAALTGTPRALYISTCSCSAAMFSCMVRFWLRLRKVSDAQSGSAPFTVRRSPKDERALEALVVEEQGRVVDARLLLEAAHDVVGVGHAGHALGIDEGDELDLLDAGFRQRIDQRDLARGRDVRFLDLEALARALFLDRYGFRHVGHDALITHLLLRRHERIRHARAAAAVGQGDDRRAGRRIPCRRRSGYRVPGRQGHSRRVPACR